LGNRRGQHNTAVVCGEVQVQQNRSKRHYEEEEAQREKIMERGEVRFISANVFLLYSCTGNDNTKASTLGGIGSNPAANYKF
jgi:hypothetical protein